MARPVSAVWPGRTSGVDERRRPRRATPAAGRRVCTAPGPARPPTAPRTTRPSLSGACPRPGRPPARSHHRAPEVRRASRPRTPRSRTTPTTPAAARPDSSGASERPLPLAMSVPPSQVLAMAPGCCCTAGATPCSLDARQDTTCLSHVKGRLSRWRRSWISLALPRSGRSSAYRANGFTRSSGSIRTSHSRSPNWLQAESGYAKTFRSGRDEQAACGRDERARWRPLVRSTRTPS